MDEFIFPFENENSIPEDIFDGFVNGSVFTLEMLNNMNFNNLCTEHLDQNDFERFESIEIMTNVSIPDSKYLFEDEFITNVTHKYLTFLNWNVRSVNLNLDTFLDMFNNVISSVDVLGLCETRLDSNISRLHEIPEYDSISPPEISKL